MPIKIMIAALCAVMLAMSTVSAQTPHWPNYNTLQTEMYFGMHSADGNGVSEQDWAAFLEDVITPRFPNGLTVLAAYGQGAGGPPRGIVAENTRLLIVVHENSDEAQLKFMEIEAAYHEKFGDKGVFRVDFPARIAD